MAQLKWSLFVGVLAAVLAVGTAVAARPNLFQEHGDLTAALPPQVTPTTVPYGFLVTSNQITNAPVASFARVLHSPGQSRVFTAHALYGPGHTTGWHTHPGPVIHNVVSGTLTLYAPEGNSCVRSTFGPGQGYIDPGYGFVHLGTNEGTAPVDFYVTFLTPADADSLTFAADAPAECAGVTK